VCDRSTLPYFLDDRHTDGGKVVSLTRRPPFTPQEDSWYSSLLEDELTPGPLCGWKDISIEKSNYLIRIRNRDLPACSIMPQPTTLPRAPGCGYIRVNKSNYPIQELVILHVTMRSDNNFILTCSIFMFICDAS
jgi:hypothetical protein